jgi:zinc finger SWIM domain-containing protein 3
LNINIERISKHNEGLGQPVGVKVKEKAVRGSRRPVGGFEKATGKKKKKSTNPIVQLQPQTSSTV